MDDAPTLLDAEWLVNRIAHALRNPIFAMTLQAETLALQCDDPATRTMLGQLEQMTAIVEDMLLYGRPAQPEPRRLSVEPLFNAIVMEYRQGVRSDPAEVRLHVEPPGLVATWDAEFVKIAVQKVLSNAVEHTPAPHEIMLEVGLEGSEVHVTVADHGEGMDGELVEKAFLPFHPQHSGRPGLGLAIAQKLLRALGGSISIESQINQGTSVHIRLPVESRA